jgi:hypothetical protein
MVRGSSRLFKYTKAQISVEYILIVAFAMAITLPMLLIFDNQSRDINEGVTDVQVNKVADEMVTAIDAVYYLGPPSSKTVDLYIPANVKNLTFTNTSFSFRIGSSHGDYEIVRWTSSYLDGSIRREKTTEGLYRFNITSNPTNVTVRG